MNKFLFVIQETKSERVFVHWNDFVYAATGVNQSLAFWVMSPAVLVWGIRQCMMLLSDCPEIHGRF